MKKIILGLFLILGAVSFAVPIFVDMAKVKNAGFQILEDEKDTFTIVSGNKESALAISYYLTDKNSKELSDAIKAEAPAELKFLVSLANNRAYVNKYKYKNEEIYTYNFVPKKQKSKVCHISVLYMTEKDLSGAALNKAVDSSLNEAESLLNF